MIKNVLIFILFLSLVSCNENIYPPLIITGAVTNIDKEGAVFHARITDLGIEQILEFGFVWDSIKSPTVESDEKYLIFEAANVRNYDAKISTNLLPNRTYYVRAFIRNSSVTTYGEETSFVSKGGKLPEIISFTPHTGNLNDTLLILGKYFSTTNSTVKINQINAEIIKSNHDSIYIIVPKTLSKKNSDITLINMNHTITFKDSFNLISPAINSFEKKSGTFQDEVIITGTNFLENPSSVQVFFDKTLAVSQVIDNHTIKTFVPNELDNADLNISVSMNNLKAVSEDKFSLLPVEIADISPKTVLTGGTITITGKNFNPIETKNKVYIGGVLAKSISVTKNSLTVALAIQDTAIYESRNASVKIDISGKVTTFKDKILINDKWFRRANAPVALGPEYQYANSFEIGNIAYIGLNERKDFWAYDTFNNTWRKMADFPGKSRIYGTGFVSGNKIYFGTGAVNFFTSERTYLNDWWEYDTATDKWTQKVNFPGGAKYTLKGFNAGGNCYAANGFYSNDVTGFHVAIWKYNPTLDSWNLENIDVSALKYYNTSYWQLAKGSGDEVYVGLNVNYYSVNNNMYLHNVKTNTFSQIAAFPYGCVYSWPICMVIDNTLYMRTYDSRNFYYYDKPSNTWKFVEMKIASDIYFGIGFEANNLGFVGLGYNSNKMYEFDPNR